MLLVFVHLEEDCWVFSVSILQGGTSSDGTSGCDFCIILCWLLCDVGDSQEEDFFGQDEEESGHEVSLFASSFKE